MASTPRFYLNLGSNIQPESNLAEALRLLRDYGDLGGISSVWESEAVGFKGPNFLNASVGFQTASTQLELKRGALAGIESALGRKRVRDKFTSRTIDIDILIADGRCVNVELWANAFVIVPMAELLPDFAHPLSERRLADEAPLAAAASWIRRRPDVTI